MPFAGRPSLVALAVVLAGCVSDPQELESGPGVPAAAPDSGPNWTAFRLPGPEAVVAGDFWANGTLSGSTGCVPPGCLRQDRRIPVGNLTLPPLPTWFLLNLTLEPSPGLGLTTGSVGLSLQAPGGRYHSYSVNYVDRHHQTLEAVITPGDDPPYVLISRYDYPLGDAPIRYALRIQSLTDASVAYPLVPVRLSLEANQWLRFESVGAGTPAILHYGSEGLLVARIQWEGENRTYEVPAAAGAGLHTLLAVAKSPPFRILTNQSTPKSTLTWGSYEVVYGPERMATTGAPISWTFSLDRQPVAVGLYMEVSQAFADAQSSRGKVESASGIVFEGTVGYSGFILAPFATYKVASLSESGHPGLVAGEYRATYTPSRPQTESVGDAALYFKF